MAKRGRKKGSRIPGLLHGRFTGPRIGPVSIGRMNVGGGGFGGFANPVIQAQRQIEAAHAAKRNIEMREISLNTQKQIRAAEDQVAAAMDSAEETRAAASKRARQIMAQANANAEVERERQAKEARKNARIAAKAQREARETAERRALALQKEQAEIVIRSWEPLLKSAAAATPAATMHPLGTPVGPTFH